MTTKPLPFNAIRYIAMQLKAIKEENAASVEQSIDDDAPHLKQPMTPI